MLNTIDADSVVIALGAESDTTLADELSEAGIEFTLIGDARKPNSILEAVHEGFLAARVV
jgi:2,4-dienoyl-CoA reductase (NADPH2)